MSRFREKLFEEEVNFVESALTKSSLFGENATYNQTFILADTTFKVSIWSHLSARCRESSQCGQN